MIVTFYQIYYYIILKLIFQNQIYKFYFDYGNQTLDKYYPKYAPLVDQIMHDKGYNGSNYKQLFFEGANHSEDAWRARLNQPIKFTKPMKNSLSLIWRLFTCFQFLLSNL